MMMVDEHVMIVDGNNDDDDRHDHCHVTRW